VKYKKADAGKLAGAVAKEVTKTLAPIIAIVVAVIAAQLQRHTTDAAKYLRDPEADDQNRAADKDRYAYLFRARDRRCGAS